MNRTVADLELGSWILKKFQKSGLSQTDIAQEAKISRGVVSQTIWGWKGSPKAQETIARLLGFSSWDALVETHRRHFEQPGLTTVQKRRLATIIVEMTADYHLDAGDVIEALSKYVIWEEIAEHIRLQREYKQQEVSK